MPSAIASLARLPRKVPRHRPRLQRGRRHRRDRRRDPRATRPSSTCSSSTTARPTTPRPLAARRRRARRCATRSTSASAAPCSPATSSRWSTATTSPSRSTATASTTRATSPSCSRTCAASPELNMVTGSRFLARDRRRLPLVGVAPRRASASSPRILSLVTRRRVTDPTSGFRMTDRRGIELFARDYPHDYPEVEAVLLVHAHRLDGAELPGEHARARGRALLDQLDALGLLHDQGAAGGARRPAARAPGGRARATTRPSPRSTRSDGRRASRSSRSSSPAGCSSSSSSSCAGAG